MTRLAARSWLAWCLSAASPLAAVWTASAQASAHVPITMTAPPPVLRVSPPGPWALGANEARPFELANVGGDTFVRVVVRPTVPWLRVEPASGDSASPLLPGESLGFTARPAPGTRGTGAGHVEILGIRKVGATYDTVPVTILAPGSTLPAPGWDGLTDTAPTWRVEMVRYPVWRDGSCAERGIASPTKPCMRRDVLPLAVGSRPAPRGRVLGFLASDSGRGLVRVESAGGAADSAQLLAFDGFSRVGTYRGSIYLDGALRRQKVNLSVLVTHGVLGALVTIVVGVLLAWRVERWLRAERTMNVFQLDILRLGAAFERAQTEFESVVRDVVETRYSIARAVGREQARLQGDFESLLQGGHVNPQDPGLTELATRVAAANAAVLGWPALARALVTLRRRHPAGGSAEIEALLEGGPLELARVADKVKEVEQAARSAEGNAMAEMAATAKANPGARPGQPFRQEARRLRDRDRVVGAILFTAAVLLALREVYLDKPFFGTPSHYVEALIWGFGAKVGLDVLRQLGSTLLARLPLVGRG